MSTIELTALKNIPFIEPGDNLIEIICNNLEENNQDVHENDVFVIAQKIISKSEDRYIDINKIEISNEAKDLANKLNRHPGLIQCVLNESKKIISIEKGVLIVEHNLGYINVNAGVDFSNIPDVDLFQIKRHNNFGPRHAGAIRKHCPGQYHKRTKQRQALLQWAYDPFI